MTLRIDWFLLPGRLAAFIAVAGALTVALPAAAQTQLPPPAYGQADERQDRIEALEGQLRDATAENERLQFELRQARREIERLRGMVGDLAGVNQTLSQPQAEAAQASPPAPSTPRAEVLPPPANSGSLGSLPASALPGDAGAAYGNARELLVNGRYAEAEVAFGQFLQSFPDAETAADARFWYAFTLYARNNFQLAVENFASYLQANPNGPRAPEAQVRLGMSLGQLGQTRQACGAYGIFARRYPNAPRNVRELAVRESRSLGCPI